MIADVAYLALGMLAGIVHFGLLRWNTRLYVRPYGLAQALGVQVLRLALLTGLLTAVALHGALPLLLAALGLLIGRHGVVRYLAGAPS
ncbi:MAG: ATP synthase subunit I [Acetobacteraceae bacterium]|nr:ATP synthase subunit I [Acetobacteraceae bacterium]